jgi:hypothetical protein
MTLSEGFDINADVVVVKGAGHLRVRPGDTGVILAKTERDTLVLIDRTQRRAWLPHQDLRCTRLGGYKAMERKHSDLSTIDLQHDMGERWLSDPFGEEGL